MALKALLTLCALSLIIQISAQYIPGSCNRFVGPEVPLSGCPAPYVAAVSPIAVAESLGFPRGFTSSFSSEFAIKSGSPITAAGISVTSENAYDGPLVVAGRLPFLSAVALEGSVPSVGAGGILYGCRSGDVIIASEGLGPVLPGNGYGPSQGYGYNGFSSYGRGIY